MKTWEYGINDYHGKGDVECIEQPWWLALIDWLGDHAAPEWTYKVKFPEIFKRRWDPEDEKLYTLGEYWGTLGDWLCCYAVNGILGWVYKHPRRKVVCIELGYERTKELFYQDDPSFFEESEAISAELRRGIWSEPCEPSA